MAAIANECHARGVPVLVDGAHVPGARALDISALGVDWYSANLHKWAHAPRGCGILWAAPDRQAMLHHPIVSWGRDRGFHHEFEHTATADPTSYLAAPEGIALLQEWDFAACTAYMHNLACTAGELLADAWGTEFTTPREMIGAMVTVPLPLSAGTTDDEAGTFARGAARGGSDRSATARVARPAVGQSFSAGLQRSQRHRTPGAGRCAQMRCRETAARVDHDRRKTNAASTRCAMGRIKHSSCR